MLALLFIPLSYAGSPPACKELGDILQTYEVNLQRDSIKDCSADFYKSLVQNIPVKNPDFLEGKACRDLATIESELNQLRMELAVMNGLHKLVETVGTAKEGTESSNQNVARVNAQTFAVSLNTAQSIEALLQTTTADGKPMIQALREVEDTKLMSQLDLSNRIYDFCKSKPKNENNACNPKVFKPGPEATTEILGMIKEGDRSKPIDLQKISKWQGQLAIKRKNPQEGDDGYSFLQMQQELGGAFENIDNKTVMTKSQIQAIQKLDDFTFDKKFAFVEELSLIKDQKKNKVASDKFVLLMGDAILRQQYEVQSKLSIVWQDIQDRMPEFPADKRAACDNAKSLYDAALECARNLEEVRPKLASTEVAGRLDDFLPTLKTSTDYVASLSDKDKVCREELRTKETVSQACFNEFNRDRADLQDKILQLNLVKEKIGSQNVEHMKFRNFALQKWTSQKCQSIASPMDMCEDTTVFAQNASMTISDSMKIAVLFTSSEAEQSKAEAEAEEICEDETRREPTRLEARLCEFFNDTTSDVLPPPKEEKAPLTPTDNLGRNKVRDAWIQAGTDLLKDVLPFYMPKTTPSGVNPYPYNYGPYNAGKPPMGIADTIMFNARYHGAYGFYMPTPGYQPYTAFGSSSPMSSYKPVSAPSTKYFSY